MINPCYKLTLKVYCKQEGDFTLDLTIGSNCVDTDVAHSLLNCNECVGENNNMCYFEVNTVSEDCWFDSPLVEATSGEFTAIYIIISKLHACIRHYMHAESPINSPVDITMFITCSLRPSYLNYVHEVDCKAYNSFSRSKLLSIYRRSVLLLR